MGRQQVQHAFDVSAARRLPRLKPGDGFVEQPFHASADGARINGESSISSEAGNLSWRGYGQTRVL